MKLHTLRETARLHKAADQACGRRWCCACAACRRIREKVKRRGGVVRVVVLEGEPGDVDA